MRRTRPALMVASGLWLMLMLSVDSGRAHADETEPLIAIVVAPSPTRSLNTEQLGLIYRRKKLLWSDGSRVAPVNLQAADPLRLQFSRRVLGTSPQEMQRYWNDMYFHGISPPHVLASQEAVIRFVAQTPGAIGYVAFCQADSRVQVVMALGANGPVATDVATASCSKRTAGGATP